MSSKKFRFGPFFLDPRTRQLQREGKPVKPGSRAFDLLLTLVENRERLVGKRELKDAVWRDVNVGDNSLDQCVTKLRQVLGDDAQNPRYVLNVPRQGYKFIAEVEEVGAEAIESTGPPNLSEATRKRRAILIGVALSAALAAAVLIAASRKDRPPPSIGDVRSVAVLPFENLGAESDEYLGPGMADALVAKLGEVDGLMVRPTSAVLKYASRKHEPADAGRELKASAALAGKFLRVNDRIRVEVRLVAVQNGSTLWEGAFDETFANISKVHDAIQQQTARALMPGAIVGRGPHLARRYTDQPRAYEHYLMGRFFLNKWTEESQYKAIENYKKALEIDPNFAPAYAGLADSYWGLSNLYTPPKQAMPLAKAAATRALEIDPNLGEAHLSLGLVMSRYDWNYVEAEKEFKMAVSLNYRDPFTHEQYGMFLASIGRFQEAQAEMQQAQILNPISASIRISSGVVHHYGGEYDEAIEQYLKAVEMEPSLYLGHLYLGIAYRQKGMFPEAVAELRKVLELNEVPMALGMLGHTLAAWARKDDAEAVLRQLEQLSRQRWVSPYYAAIIYVGLGKKQEALSWLRKAYEERAEDITFIRVDPLLEPLRGEPEFRSLVARL